MLLSTDETKLFFQLNGALLNFVNQEMRVSSEPTNTDDFHAVTPLAVKAKLRDAVAADCSWIDSFLTANPNSLGDDELKIVDSWRHQIHGTFYVYRQLAEHAIFLAAEEETSAFAVIGLSQPFDHIVQDLPAMVQTVLLPLNDKIICDGLIAGYNVPLGEGIRRMLDDAFQSAVSSDTIVTSLIGDWQSAQSTSPAI